MMVADASVVLALSVDDANHRRWAAEVIGDRAAAPHEMPVEVAHALRRLEALGRIPPKTAASALETAITLDIELWPFAPFAKRVWELRGSVTAYDAWYVALAETLQLPLATLDRRLAAANGPRCEFVVPE